jgi:glycosyltransferase involved in cell wall biosynthesis
MTFNNCLRACWHFVLPKSARDVIYRLRRRLAFFLVPGSTFNPPLSVVQIAIPASMPRSAPNPSRKSISILFRKAPLGTQLLAHRSEESVIDEPSREGLIPYEVAGRKRLATCSGVSWFMDRYLAVVNLYGCHLRIYKLEETKNIGEKQLKLRLLHQLSEGMHFPEDVAVSKNGNMLAVTHSLAEIKGISFHKIDSRTKEPAAAFERLRSEYTCHGVQFAPDSGHAAFTTVDGPGTVEVIDITLSPLRTASVLENRYPHLRPKIVSFTEDGKYAAIVYSPVINPISVSGSATGLLEIHRYYAESGTIEKACEVSLKDGGSMLSCLESAVFLPKSHAQTYRLLASNQANDVVIEVLFDPQRRSLEISGRQLPGLSFPHGIDISEDGELFAVANYGDDTVRIFQIAAEIHTHIEDARTHVLLCGHSASDRLFGAERSLVDLAAALSSLGYRISCLLPHDCFSYTAELAKHVDLVLHLPFEWWNHPRPFDEDNVGRIENFIRRESIDIVHVNSTVVPDALLAARRAGVPGILHVRELLEEDAELAQLLGCDGDGAIGHLAREADFFIANSEASQRQFKAEGHSFCLYNTVDLRRFEIPGISLEGKLKIGMLSNNTQRKGIADFIGLAIAAREEASLEFFLIGPVSENIRSLQAQLAAINPAPNIRFVDFIPDPVQAMALLDVVVSLPQIGESFGRSIVEAMAARRPVVVYDRGAMPEIVLHNETGFLVPAGDTQQVLKHLQWLAKNRVQARKMGEAGQLWVQKSFSKERYQAKLSEIYAHILDYSGKEGKILLKKVS